MSLNQTIYQIYAAKYYELGFNPIPIFGKRPHMSGWSEFCKRRMTEEELHKLEGLAEYGGGACGGAQVGIALGSGLVAIDIDTNDERITSLLPYSPMSKRGRTGLTRIYRVEKTPKSQSHQTFPVELLSVGRQTAVPPSIHPDTGKPYKWDEDVSWVGVSDLPLIEAEEVFSTIVTACREHRVLRLVKDAVKNSVERSDSGKLPDALSGGRNNYLTRFIYAKVTLMEMDGITVQEMADLLLEEDHRVFGASAWLSDPAEGHGTPRQRALAMVERAIKSAKERGDYFDASSIQIEIEQRAVAVETPTESTDILQPLSDDEIQSQLLDEVMWLKLWSRYVEQKAYKYSPTLTLGSGLAVLAAMAGNLYAIGNLRSNMMILNVAGTGQGKNAPQVAIKDLMMACRSECETYIPSVESYKSAAVMLRGFDLHHRRIKLDVQDEVGKYFEQFGDSGTPFSGGIENFCQLFSASETVMGSHESQDRTRAVKAIANPILVWFGSTTHTGAQQSVTGVSARKGLPGRILYMIQDDRDWGDDYYKEIPEHVPVPPALVQLTSKYLKMKARFADELASDTAVPQNERMFICDGVETKDGYVESLREFNKRTAQLVKSHGEEAVQLADMMQRRGELLKKLLICWYVGNDCKIPVGKSAVRWAARVLDHSFAKVYKYLELQLEPLSQKVEREIINQYRGKTVRLDKLRDKVERRLKYWMNRDPSSHELKMVMERVGQHLAESGKDEGRRRVVQVL